MKTVLAIAILFASACITSSSSYEEHVRSMMTTERADSNYATLVVASVFQISTDDVNVKWIMSDDSWGIQGSEDGAQNGILWGAAFGCDVFVYAHVHPVGVAYPFSTTSLAHEMAHCALWLRTGDADQNHTHQDWWNVQDGLVMQAMHALQSHQL